MEKCNLGTVVQVVLMSLRVWNFATLIHSMVSKPEGNKPLGRPRSSRVDNVKVDHG
jgi:hypothetical protein